MKAIYTLGIYTLRLVMQILALWNPKIKKGIEGRKYNAKKLSEFDNSKPTIWMHCASLGEYEMGIPLLEKIALEKPNYQFVITFFSPSGYDEVAAKSPHTVLYLPFDIPKLQNNLIDIIQPELVIFVKYEYWYNLIQVLSDKKIPQVVISAVMDENKIFFKSYGSWFLKQIRKINYFFVQDTSSLQLLENKGITQAIVAGDTRFDRVKENISVATKFPLIEKFKDNKPLFIGGSIWEEGQHLIKNVIRHNEELKLKFIIAPHEVGPRHIIEIKNDFSQILSLESVQLYSEISENTDFKNVKMIIIDQIGILKYIYQYANISYVGGGFKKGGLHNILEPAVYGNALVIGPEYQKFPEAKEMLAENALISIKNSDEFSTTILKLLDDPNYLKLQSEKAKKYIYGKPNSVAVIYNEMLRLLR